MQGRLPGRGPHEDAPAHLPLAAGPELELHAVNPAVQVGSRQLLRARDFLDRFHGDTAVVRGEGQRRPLRGRPEVHETNDPLRRLVGPQPPLQQRLRVPGADIGNHAGHCSHAAYAESSCTRMKPTAPIALPRTTIGTHINERNPSSRRMRRCSGLRARAVSKESVTFAYNSGLAVRMTLVFPNASFRSSGISPHFHKRSS